MDPVQDDVPSIPHLVTNSKPQPVRKAASQRLFVERLEDRRLLAGPFASGNGAILNLVLAQLQQASGPMRYTTDQFRQTYGFDQIPGLSNYNQAGQRETIAIVDAYGDPNLRSDVQHFDETLNTGGAAGDSSNKNFLNVVNETGGNNLPATQPDSGWDFEERLDVAYDADQIEISCDDFGSRVGE